METAIVLKPMIYKEARECADRINAGIDNVRRDVVDLHDREGWSALGYSNWTECVEKEFEQARRYIFYQFAAAQIEQNITGCTKVHLGTIPETHLRPLAKLPPEKQKEAYQQAVETAPKGKVTAAHVYKVVKDMMMPDNAPVGNIEESEESDAVFQLKRWWKKATIKDRKIFLILIFAPALGALAFAAKCFKKEVIDFERRYFSGEDLSSGSPILTFRNYMLQRPPRGGTFALRRAVQLNALTCIADHIKGETRKKITPSQIGYEFFSNKQKKTINQVCDFFKY